MKTRYLIQIVTVGPAAITTLAISFVHAYEIGHYGQTLVYSDWKAVDDAANLLSEAVSFVQDHAGRSPECAELLLDTSAVVYLEGDRAPECDPVAAMAMDHVYESLQQEYNASLARAIGMAPGPRILCAFHDENIKIIKTLAQFLTPTAARDFLSMIFATYAVNNAALADGEPV